MRREIAIVVFPGFQLLDAAGPVAVFEVAERFQPDNYALSMLSPRGGLVASSSGVSLSSAPLERRRFDTVIVSGGDMVLAEESRPAIVDWLCDHAWRRSAGVCSGAFFLADAGLLDGRRATTHWDAADRFRQRYPKVRLNADRMFIRDGDVWTSAGISAGIDLALALVEEDLGPAVARRTAQQLVVHQRRPGGQSQYSALLERGGNTGRFGELIGWMRARLSAQRRCIVPDFMGLGYSEPAPGQDLRAPAQAAMIVALLDKLGVDTVDLVANDSGCAVAQLLLARHGGRIRSALLTNGDTEPDCPPKAILGVIEMAKAGTFANAFQPCLDDKDACRKPGKLGGDTFTFPERLRDDTIQMYLAPLAEHKDRTNAYGRAAEGNPLAGISVALRQVKAPVRVVWGTGDTIFKAAMPDYLDKLFPNSRGVLRVPGAKLFFPEEFPDLIARELRVLWRIGAD